MHLHQISRLIGFGLGFAAVSFLAAGVWTFTFEETEGTLIENERKRIRPVGEYIQGKGNLSHLTVEDIDVCYRYSVGLPIFESCRIGSGVSHITLSPLARESWEISRVGTKVRVFYSPLRPEIAVLHQGPDWIMVVGLGVLALFFFVAAGKLAAVELPPNNALKGRRAKRARP